MTLPTPIKATVLCFISAIIFSSCTKKDNAVDFIYVLRGTADLQIKDSSLSKTSYGTIYGGYSATNKKMAFNINWVNLSSAATGASFHLERSLRADSIVKIFPVTEGNFTGLAAGEMFLNEEEAASLLNGKWFYTVNTVDHPNGELTGKIYVDER